MPRTQQRRSAFRRLTGNPSSAMLGLGVLACAALVFVWMHGVDRDDAEDSRADTPLHSPSRLANRVQLQQEYTFSSSDEVLAPWADTPGETRERTTALMSTMLTRNQLHLAAAWRSGGCVRCQGRKGAAKHVQPRRVFPLARAPG